MMKDRTNYAHIKWAELDHPMRLSERKVWTGIYRGIGYEINNFSIGESFPNCWSHYIRIDLRKQLEADLAAKFWLVPDYKTVSPGGREYLSYEYYSSIVEDLDWHGGCTFYEKLGGPDAKQKVIKIGCDYQHYHDDGNHYSELYVYSEVVATIESLYRIANGKIKIRSCGDGQFRFLEDFQNETN